MKVDHDTARKLATGGKLPWRGNEVVTTEPPIGPTKIDEDEALGDALAAYYEMVDAIDGSVVGDGDMLHSWESDVSTFGWGVDVDVTVFKNVWISLGYNFAGFRDDDFSVSNYTAQGPFITVRIKADQDTFHGLLNRGAEQ